jgi:hypothetical protein
LPPSSDDESDTSEEGVEEEDLKESLIVLGCDHPSLRDDLEQIIDHIK